MTHQIRDAHNVTSFDGADHLVIVCECGAEFSGDPAGTRARHNGHVEILQLRAQIEGGK